MPNWKAIAITAWNDHFNPHTQPYATGGELDLRDIVFSDNRKVTLDGEWDFYPDQRYQSGVTLTNPAPIQVPNEGMSTVLGTTKGQGVYHLRVKVPYNKYIQNFIYFHKKEVHKAYIP